MPFGRLKAFLLGAIVLGLLSIASQARATPGQSLAARAERALAPFPPRAAVIFDPAAGRVLYGLHPDERLPPASLAKMITALLTAERLHPSDPITISRTAALAQADQIRWARGATFTADQVLHGMMMESSNGAAFALAQRFAGSLRGFIPMANARAAELGATRTHIVDPSGLDRIGQYSTAHDLALMAAAVLGKPWIARVVATKSYGLRWSDGKRATFHNLDRFLLRYPGAVGIKNGFTTKAGNCVAAAATLQGRTMIVIVLNDSRVFDTAAALMDLAFDAAGINPHTAAAEASPPLVDNDYTQAARNGVLATTPPPRARGTRVPASIWLALGLMSAYGARVHKVKRRAKRRRLERRRAQLARARAAVVRHEMQVIESAPYESAVEYERRRRTTV